VAERKKNYTFYLDPQLLDEVREAAERERRPLNSYVSVQLEKAVKRSSASWRRRDEQDDEDE
jgi:hypothetical protein